MHSHEQQGVQQPRYTHSHLWERTLQQHSAEIVLSALKWTSFCVSSLSTCAYRCRQDLITPRKSHKRGLRQRTPCSYCIWTEHPVSGYLPSCPVQAQQDKSTASLPFGSKPCLSTCIPVGLCCQPCYQKHHVPLQTQANGGGGWPHWMCPWEYGGLSPCLPSLQLSWL